MLSSSPCYFSTHDLLFLTHQLVGINENLLSLLARVARVHKCLYELCLAIGNVWKRRFRFILVTDSLLFNNVSLLARTTEDMLFGF